MKIMTVDFRSTQAPIILAKSRPTSLAVELAGVLLLLALVGAVAIVEHGRLAPAFRGQDSNARAPTSAGLAADNPEDSS